MWACVSTRSIIKIDHPSTTIAFNSKVQEIEKWKYLVSNQNWSSMFIRSSKKAPTAASCSLILLHKRSFSSCPGLEKFQTTVADLLHTWKMRSPLFLQAPNFFIIISKKNRAPVCRLSLQDCWLINHEHQTGSVLLSKCLASSSALWRCVQIHHNILVRFLKYRRRFHRQNWNWDSK